jgi:ATP-dependent DNA helicase RecQ
LRKRLADERGVPPYIVFSDVSLRQMARLYPTNENEFARISGVGQVKLRDFGETFIGEITSFLASNPHQIFADDSFAAPLPSRAPRLNDTARETLRHFRAGRNIEEIAKARMLAHSTICGHLTTAVEAGEVIDLNQLLTAAEQESIRAAFAKCGFGNLVGTHEHLGGKFDMSLLRLCRAAQQRR